MPDEPKIPPEDTAQDEDITNDSELNPTSQADELRDTAFEPNPDGRGGGTIKI